MELKELKACTAKEIFDNFKYNQDSIACKSLYDGLTAAKEYLVSNKSPVDDDIMEIINGEIKKKLPENLLANKIKVFNNVSN